jgi:hypothetical protein
MRLGSGVGHITDFMRPVTRVKWPKGRGKKEFFERLFKPPEK